jgi:hypothetical protein
METGDLNCRADPAHSFVGILTQVLIKMQEPARLGGYRFAASATRPIYTI